MRKDREQGMRSAFIANGGGKFCRFVYLSEPCCAQGRAIKKTQVSRKIGYFTTLRTLHNAPHERAKQIIANGTATASVKPIPTASLIAMEKLSETFRRNSDGSWTCIALASLNGPDGRIQVTPGTTFAPGTIFMGVELVAWLDAQAKTEEGGSSLSVVTQARTSPT
jgi:hypothetical protein